MTVRAGSSFRLRVLGAPELTDEGGQTPPALGWGKPLALLCYLALRVEVRRDEIVDLLWRDVDEGKARNAFRQALHRLRTALGDDLIPHDRDKLRLGRSERLSIDVAEFEMHLTAGRIGSAVDTYTGDFLEGFELDEPAFDHWADQERTRLRSRFRLVLQDAVREASANGQWAEAIARVKRLQRLAPFETDAAKLAATTLLSAGRRGEALDLLKHFAARTEGELGIPVDADLKALMARLAREPISTPQVTRQAPVGSHGIVSLPFVGREAELSQLLGLWQTVGEDSGALALIEGEAGIGKTRLVLELVAHARALGPILVITGRERSAGAQLPYGIFGEALRPLVHAPGVAGASAHLLAEAARILPEMRDSFDLPQVSAVEDEGSRLRFFEGVAALMDAAAYEQRLLVVLEELQHIPPSSLDLLSYVAARLAGAPIMFVLTARSSESGLPVLSRLRALAGSAASEDSHSHGTRSRLLTLGPLSADVALSALGELASRTGLSAPNLERIVRQSGGNPLRLLQNLRGAAAGEEASTSPVPLRDLLLDRLQRLSSTQRRVFVVLALLGRSAPIELLAAATHVSESSCREAVRVLEQQGLVEQTDAGVHVTNDLASETASDVAGSDGRAFLSGWIAEALAREPDAEPAELARLYATAGNAVQAFLFARRAAYASLATGAAAEATQLFMLARTFAASAEEQGEIEGALDALGSGRRRLPTGTASSRPTRDEARLDTRAAAEKPDDRSAPAAPSARFERLFPNWRVLFGAAIATLLISAAVLSLRSGAFDVLRSSGSGDTLLVSEGLGDAGWRRLAVGSLAKGYVLTRRIGGPRFDPPWVDSLPHQWIHPLPGPRGRRVAVSRVTARGVDLFVISGDRRDSLTLLADQSSVTPLAWSPDGNWLLAVRDKSGRGTAHDMALYAFRVVGERAQIAIDTTPRHSVTEALWSPDGSHIAWTARVGDDKQQDVFTSLADGGGARNLSREPAEDYHIAWSPDGDVLAFTSTRDGNPEIYAADLIANRLLRLTQNPALDDRATFSPDGRTIAFESTRGRVFAIYVMPALGGEARRVVNDVPVEIVGWRGQRSRFVDYVRIAVGDVAVGASATLRLRAFDEVGDSIPVRDVDWHILDSALVRFASPADTASPTRTLVGMRGGLARVVGTLGSWRSDTAFVWVGTGRVSILQEDFAGRLDRWRALGDPGPLIRGDGPTRALLLRSNREWDSGVLSRASFPLVSGLTLSARVAAPWSSAPDASTEAVVALVAPVDQAVIDSTAPQFQRLASIVWRADAGRLLYAVGREVFTEPVTSSAAATRRVGMYVEGDSTVSFFVDEKLRWRSTLRLEAPRSGTRAQLWIGARATADLVRVTSVLVALAARDRTSHSD